MPCPDLCRPYPCLRPRCTMEELKRHKQALANPLGRPCVQLWSTIAGGRRNGGTGQAWDVYKRKQKSLEPPFALTVLTTARNSACRTSGKIVDATSSGGRPRPAALSASHPHRRARLWRRRAAAFPIRHAQLSAARAWHTCWPKQTDQERTERSLGRGPEKDSLRAFLCPLLPSSPLQPLMPAVRRMLNWVCRWPSALHIPGHAHFTRDIKPAFCCGRGRNSLGDGFRGLATQTDHNSLPKPGYVIVTLHSHGFPRNASAADDVRSMCTAWGRRSIRTADFGDLLQRSTPAR